MKDALKRAVDILFHGLPFSYTNNEFKEEILEAAVQKYDADRADGMTEAEAAGNILVHFGNAEELCGHLGIERMGDQAQAVEESSLEYKGIRLTYGYSIDYLAMPGIDQDTEQRGATLITIGREGGFSITPYRLIDLEDKEGLLPPEKSEAPGK